MPASRSMRPGRSSKSQVPLERAPKMPKAICRIIRMANSPEKPISPARPACPQLNCMLLSLRTVHFWHYGIRPNFGSLRSSLAKGKLHSKILWQRISHWQKTESGRRPKFQNRVTLAGVGITNLLIDLSRIGRPEVQSGRNGNILDTTTCAIGACARGNER